MTDSAPETGVKVPVIHAVTDDTALLRRQFLAEARAVMTALGERGAVHVRSRLLGGRSLFETTVALRELEDTTGCLVVVNDRIDVAMAAGARAVQLTSRSPRVPEVRALCPGVRLGVSVHSPADAVAADMGAEWCIAGQAYDSATHPGRESGGPEFISAIARVSKLPVIAIGGVTPERVSALLNAGAHGVAAIRGIWSAENAGAAAGRYLSEYVAAERSGGHDLADGQR